MNALHKAEAAARAGLRDGNDHHALLCDLLAALDAARGEAVAWSRDEYIYDDEGRPIGTDEVKVLWRTRPDPNEGWQPLYAAPPAAAVPEVLVAARSLRAAQVAYMANRGNEELGKAVAQAAAELDTAIAKAEGVGSEQ